MGCFFGWDRTDGYFYTIASSLSITTFGFHHQIHVLHQHTSSNTTRHTQCRCEFREAQRCVGLCFLHLIHTAQSTLFDASNYSAFHNQFPCTSLDMPCLLLIDNATVLYACNACPLPTIHSFLCTTRSRQPHMPSHLHKLLLQAISRPIADVLANLVVACLLSNDKISEACCWR